MHEISLPCIMVLVALRMPDSMAMLWYDGFSNEHGFEDGGILRKDVLSLVASHIAIVRNQVSFNERNVCTVVTKKNQPLIWKWMVDVQWLLNLTRT